MTGRLRIRIVAISAGIALGLACTPTEPCACPPARSAFAVYGRVLRADGTPGAGGRLRFDASDWRRGADCDFAAFAETLDPWPAPVTDEAGDFRVRVYSSAEPGIRCLRVTAFRGAPGATDSVRLIGLLVEFRNEKQPLDSLGLRLTLP
jgi:hypothetical protein